MSIPAWPEELEYRPINDSFAIQEPHVPPLTTEFEGGAFRRRPRTTVRRAVFAMTWKWSAADYGQFRTFYHSALIEGTMRFTMPVKDGPAGGFISRTCQFREMYQAAISGAKWRVSAELYVFGGM